MRAPSPPAFRTLTARPFCQTPLHREIAPCPSLRPYIRCFWGGDAAPAGRAALTEPQVIIPDCCADLIFRINETRGQVACGFTGIADRPANSHFAGQGADRVSTFGIRFYGWSAYRFAEGDLEGSANSYLAGEERFGSLTEQVAGWLPRLYGLEQRAAWAEKLLLERMEKQQGRILEQAAGLMLQSEGRMTIEAIAREVFISRRQLERVFQKEAGISPKALSAVIRYQLVWQAALQPGFDIRDAVARFGFADESHLRRSFARFHQMGIREARAYAQKDVANLQDG